MLKTYARARKAVVAGLTAGGGLFEVALVDGVLTAGEVSRAVLAAVATAYLTYNAVNDAA